MPFPFLLAAAVAAKAAGTGYSMSQSKKAARAAEASAEQEALLLEQDMRLKGKLEMGAAKISIAQERAKRAALAAIAKNYRSEAAGHFKFATEERRRTELDGERLLASQHAAAASSGLSMEGTPVAIAMETANAIRMDVVQALHQRDKERVSMINKANEADAESNASRIETLNQKALLVAGKFKMLQAPIAAARRRLEGATQAAGYRSQRTATAINGISDMLSSGYSAKQNGAFGNTKSIP